MPSLTKIRTVSKVVSIFVLGMIWSHSDYAKSANKDRNDIRLHFNDIY